MSDLMNRREFLGYMQVHGNHRSIKNIKLDVFLVRIGNQAFDLV